MPALIVLIAARNREQIHDVEPLFIDVNKYTRSLVLVHLRSRAATRLIPGWVRHVPGRDHVHPILAGKQRCSIPGVATRAGVGLVHGDGVVRHRTGIPLSGVVPAERVAEVGEDVHTASVQFEVEVVRLAMADDGRVVEDKRPCVLVGARLQDPHSVAVHKARSAGDL